MKFFGCYFDVKYEWLVLVRVNYRFLFRGSGCKLRFGGDKIEVNVKLIKDEL